jgi:hypothetical protein
MDKISSSLKKNLSLENIICLGDCFYAPVKNKKGQYMRYKERIILQKLIPNYEIYILDNNNFKKPSISTWGEKDLTLLVEIQRDIDYNDLNSFYKNNFSK